MLIDSHSHVHFVKNFPDQEEVLLRAREVGVLKQVIIGCNILDSIETVKFAQSHEGLFAVVGIHPHDALEVTEANLQKLRNLISGEGEFDYLKKAPVAIGEIGLDYFRNPIDPEIQKKAFYDLLKLAQEFDLPAVIHVREAFSDAQEVLQEAGNKKVVLHCFSGNMEEAKWAWNHGFLTSFSGVLTYPKNLELQEIARKAPESLFLVETDCPFLAPQKYRGQRNEPAFVQETARFIAELRGVRAEVVAEITTANAERFFGI